MLVLLAAGADALGGDNYLGLVSDNDLYVDGRDRHYTAGTQLAWAMARGAAPRWLSWPGALSPLDGGAAAREVSLAIGQVIATPEDLAAANPDPTDRPYAGWLYGDLAVINHAGMNEDEIGLSVGTLGPASLAAKAHRLLHDLTPSVKPRGWHAQVDDEPTLQLRYRFSRFIPVKPDDVWKGDLVPRAQLSLGNVYTGLDLGLAWRFGSYVPRRDLPARIGPGLASATPRFEARRGRTDWMFRADVVGHLVAHNVFLDGSLFDDDSPGVDSRSFAWQASAGVQFTCGTLPLPFAFGFTYVWRESEFHGQRGMNRYGSVNLALRF
ncbi:MAG: lipid A deacylase LpxR family protein [Gammaproteobacteria bacterium]|nr:lipid A deacylase LpxR family protein [Gammaproteobacteria bacterium]MCP5200344.1 lipid A deacylase LpxR family protein [Gammaproteobacteria bacterium]